MCRYDPYPDAVIHGGQVLTVDPAFTVARAMAIKDGRVVAVGSRDEVLATPGSRTRRIDLGGRTVIPGFVDTHAHLDREGLRRTYPDLQGCRSIADVQEVIRRAAAGREPGQWIVVLPLGTPPFHEDQAQSLAERRFPGPGPRRSRAVVSVFIIAPVHGVRDLPRPGWAGWTSKAYQLDAPGRESDGGEQRGVGGPGRGIESGARRGAGPGRG
jgi:hypothetical protein